MPHALTMLVLVTLCAGPAIPAAEPGDPAPDAARDRRARLDSASRHVRAVGATMEATIAEGVRRSPTVADMVRGLNASDVVVYVEGVALLPPRVQARMSLIGSPRSGPRYLRVQILAALSLPERVALLGHELQHALEVAGSPEVRDDASLARFYKRIGDGTRHTHQYDTAAARNAGRQVRRELTGI